MNRLIGCPGRIACMLGVTALCAALHAAPPSVVTSTRPAPASAPAEWTPGLLVAPEPSVTRFVLPNGLRVAVLRHPDLRTLGVYTYLPGGFLADDAKHAMWARLVERLVTQTGGFSDGAVEPSFTRLETRAWPEELDAALDEHRRLLLPMSFKTPLIELYREDVIAEACYREQSERRYPLYSKPDSFRAAEAALGQAWFHGRTNVLLEDDLGKTELAEVEAYHKLHWRSGGGLLCIVGNVDPAQAEAAVRKRFSWPMDSAPWPTAPRSGAQDLRVTWDLSNRYYLMAWPTPERSPREHAALMTARCLLGMSWERGMNWYAGLISVRMNVRTPAGPVILLGISLRPDASPEAAREMLEQRLDWLRHVEEKEVEEARQYASVLLCMALETEYVRSSRLSGIKVKPEAATFELNGQSLSDTAREEETRFREWCDLEWYYGANREMIRREVEAIRASDVARVVEKFLSPRNAIRVTILPKAP